MGARSRLALFALSLIVLVSYEWRAARSRAGRKATEALRKASAVTELRIADSVAHLNKLEQAVGAYARAYENDHSVDLKSRGLKVVYYTDGKRRLELVHPAKQLTKGEPKIPIHKVVGVDTIGVQYTVRADGSDARAAARDVAGSARSV